MIHQQAPMGNFPLPQLNINMVDPRLQRNARFLVEDLIAEIRSKATMNQVRNYCYMKLAQNNYQNQDFTDLVQLTATLIDYELYRTNRDIGNISSEIIPDFYSSYMAALINRDRPFQMTNPDEINMFNNASTKFQYYMGLVQQGIASQQHHRAVVQQGQMMQQPNYMQSQMPGMYPNGQMNPNMNPSSGSRITPEMIDRATGYKFNPQDRPANMPTPLDNMIALGQRLNQPAPPSQFTPYGYDVPQMHPQQMYWQQQQQLHNNVVDGRFGLRSNSTQQEAVTSADAQMNFYMRKNKEIAQQAQQPYPNQAVQVQQRPSQQTIGRFATPADDNPVKDVSTLYYPRPISEPTPAPTPVAAEQTSETMREKAERLFKRLRGTFPQPKIEYKHPGNYHEMGEEDLARDRAYDFPLDEMTDEQLHFFRDYIEAFEQANEVENRYGQLDMRDTWALFSADQNLETVGIYVPVTRMDFKCDLGSGPCTYWEARFALKLAQHEKHLELEAEKEKQRRLKLEQEYTAEARDELAKKSKFHEAAFSINADRGESDFEARAREHFAERQAQLGRAVTASENANQAHANEQQEDVGYIHAEPEIRTLSDEEYEELFGHKPQEAPKPYPVFTNNNQVVVVGDEEDEEGSFDTESDDEVEAEDVEEVVEDAKEDVHPWDIPDEHGVTERERYTNEFRDRNFKRRWKPNRHQRSWQYWEPLYFVCKLEEIEPGCLVQRFYPRNANTMELRNHLKNVAGFHPTFIEPPLVKPEIEPNDKDLGIAEFVEPTVHNAPLFLDSLGELAIEANRNVVDTYQNETGVLEKPVTFEAVLSNPIVTKGNYSKYIDELAQCEQLVDVHRKMTELQDVLPYSIWKRVDEWFTREINDFLAYGLIVAVDIDSFYYDFEELSVYIDENDYLDPLAIYFKPRMKNLFLQSSDVVYRAGVKTCLGINEEELKAFEKDEPVSSLIANETWLAERISLTLVPVGQIGTDVKVGQHVTLSAKNAPELLELAAHFGKDECYDKYHDQYVQTTNSDVFRLVRNAFNRKYFHAVRVM